MPIDEFMHITVHMDLGPDFLNINGDKQRYYQQLRSLFGQRKQVKATECRMLLQITSLFKLQINLKR